VAYVDSTQTVHLNAEHSAYRWVSFSEACALVPFGGQRRLYEEVRREFVDRAPSPLHEITLGDDSGA
jgi:dATP pyrophosphohydrolase